MSMPEVEGAMISEREGGAVRQFLQQVFEDAKALASVPGRMIESARREPGIWGKLSPVGAGLYLAFAPVVLACNAIASGDIPTAIMDSVTFMGLQCSVAGVCLEMESQAEPALPQAS